MATKIIRIHDNTYTYLPVTIADAVQYTSGIGKISVQQAIDNVSAAALEVAQSLSSYVTVDALNAAAYIQEHQDLGAYATSLNYDSGEKKIYLKNGDTTLSEIDASVFINDGMVDGAVVENGNLVITFNTDAGKQDITVPVADIFDASNYYTKSDIDNAGYLQTHQDLSSYVTKDELSAAGYITSHQDLNEYVTATDLENAAYLQAETDPTVPAYVKNITGTNIDLWNDALHSRDLYEATFDFDATSDIAANYTRFSNLMNQYYSNMTDIDTNAMSILSNAITTNETATVKFVCTMSLISAINTVMTEIESETVNVGNSRLSDWTLVASGINISTRSLQFSARDCNVEFTLFDDFGTAENISEIL